MKIKSYKNIEYSKVLSSEIEGKIRIDADYYEPYYIRLISKIENKECDFLLNLASNSYEGFKKSENELFEYIEISAVDLSNGAFETELLETKEAPSRATKLVTQNSILVSTVRPIRSAIAYVTESKTNLVASSGFCQLKALKINSKYLFALLKTDIYRDLLVRLTTSTMYPTFAENDLMNLPIPIPSSSFQYKIAKIVTNSFNQTQEAEKYYKIAEMYLEESINLKNWKAPQKKFKINEVIFEADLTNNKIYSHNIQKFADRLDSEYWEPAVLEIIEKIKNTDYTHLYEFVTATNGYSWKSDFFGEKGNGLPFVRIRDCKPTYIDNENLSTLNAKYVESVEHPQAQKGDITVGMDGLKYFYGSLIIEPVFVNQRVCHLKMRENCEVAPEYIVFIINSKIGQTQLLRQMTIADTVGHITNSDVYNLLIPLFDKDIRDNITESVKKAIQAEIKAKELIKFAKKTIEIYIENDEHFATEFINDNFF